MKLKITFSNPGGELDSRIVEDDGEAAGRALIEMLENITDLHAGDTITVTEVPD